MVEGLGMCLGGEDKRNRGMREYEGVRSFLSPILS